MSNERTGPFDPSLDEGPFEPDDETSEVGPTQSTPTTPAERSTARLRQRQQDIASRQQRVVERTIKDDARSAIYARRSRDLEAESLEGLVLFFGGSRDDHTRLLGLKINQEFEKHHKHLLIDDAAYEIANRVARERVEGGAHERLTPNEFAAVVASITEQELATRGSRARQSTDASRYIEQMRHARLRAWFARVGAIGRGDDMSGHFDDELRARIKRLREDAVEALLCGNDRRSAELSAEADGLLLEAVVKHAAEAPATNQLEHSASKPPSEPEPDPRAAAINSAFGERFADLDDAAFRDAAAIARARIDDPAFAHLSPMEFAQEIGSAVRKMHSKPEREHTASIEPPQPTPTPPSVDVDQLRRASARRYVEQLVEQRYPTPKR